MSADGNDMEETKRHPGGRPTDYRPEYCEQAIAWGKAGKSRAWIAAELGVCKRTLVNWEEAHPEFLSALRRAKTLEQQWWEDSGQSGMIADKFNGLVWGRSMAARFPDDWREVSRQESSGIDGKPIEQKTVVEWVVKEPTPLGPK